MVTLPAGTEFNAEDRARSDEQFLVAMSNATLVTAAYREKKKKSPPSNWSAAGILGPDLYNPGPDFVRLNVFTVNIVSRTYQGHAPN